MSACHDAFVACDLDTAAAMMPADAVLAFPGSRFGRCVECRAAPSSARR